MQLLYEFLLNRSKNAGSSFELYSGVGPEDFQAISLTAYLEIAYSENFPEFLLVFLEFPWNASKNFSWIYLWNCSEVTSRIFHESFPSISSRIASGFFLKLL